MREASYRRGIERRREEKKREDGSLDKGERIPSCAIFVSWLPLPAFLRSSTSSFQLHRVVTALYVFLDVQRSLRAPPPLKVWLQRAFFPIPQFSPALSFYRLRVERGREAGRGGTEKLARMRAGAGRHVTRFKSIIDPRAIRERRVPPRFRPLTVYPLFPIFSSSLRRETVKGKGTTGKELCRRDTSSPIFLFFSSPLRRISLKV